MKKRFLCFALAAMLLGGNAMTAMPVYAGGNTTITATKAADAPYTGREYIAPMDKTRLSDIMLPDGWSWLNADQALTTEFKDAVVVLTVNGAEANRVTVMVKKEPDTEAPTGKIIIETNNWNTFLNTVTFNQLFKMTKTVTIAAEDNVGVASIQYYASAIALTLEQLKALGAEAWLDYPENGFMLAPTSNYVVYALITDTSGNKTYISSDGLVFLTEKAPDIFVTAIGKDSFTVKANVDEKSLDGIQEVGIKYRKSGDSTWTVVKADSVRASNEFTVTGLSAGESYEIRAFASYIDETSSETAEANAVTITTQAQTAADGSITVTIKSEVSESRDAVITIEKGNSIIATATVNGITSSTASQSSVFKDLPDGVYNVVVRTTDGRFVETRVVTIKDGNVGDVTFTILEGELKSVVDVAGDVPPVAVEGLSDILNDTRIVSEDEIRRVKDGELSVTIKLQATSADTSGTGASRIENLAKAKNYNVAMLLDLSLYKITKDLTVDNAAENEVNIGSLNTKVLEIAVPYDTSIENLSVFRYHGDAAKELTRLSTQPDADYTDGTFYVGDGYIYIYASGFSIYGITEPGGKSEGSDASSGGSGGNSSGDSGSSGGSNSSGNGGGSNSSSSGGSSSGSSSSVSSGSVGPSEKIGPAAPDTADTAAGEALEITNPDSPSETAHPSTMDRVVTLPKTGDESRLVLWGSLFVCSAAAFGISLVIGRRKFQHNRRRKV